MVVSAVSGINVNKTYRNNISFGNNQENEELQSSQRQPRRASNLVKVPVIVMMTLSPSLLNSAGAAAENQFQDEFPQTELLAMAAPEPQSTTTRTTTRQSTYVRPQIVQYSKKFTSNGTTYTMYYVNPNKASDPKNNYVRDVYFIPNGYSPQHSGSLEEIPPRLTKIRLHEVPGQDAFVGAIVKEKKTNQDWYQKEIKLPDDIANGLMDLVKERTNLRVVEGCPLDKIFWGINMDHTTSPELIKEHWTN